MTVAGLSVYFPAVKLTLVVILALLSFSCAAGAQQPAPVAPAPPGELAPPVPTEALVGQSVAVMPITLIAADPALQSDTIYAPYRDRQTTLLWADSLIGEAFTRDPGLLGELLR